MRRTTIAGINTSVQNLATKQRKDFIINRNDTFYYEYEHKYYDTNGTLITYDFTDCAVLMHIKKNVTDKPLRTFSVTIDVDKLGLTIALSAESMDLEVGKYFYDIEILDANSRNLTILWGYISVLQDITEWEGIFEQKYSIAIEEKTSYKYPEYIPKLISEMSTAINVLMQYAFNTNKVSLGLETDISYEYFDIFEKNNIPVEMSETITFTRMATAEPLCAMESEISYIIYIKN